MGTTPCGKLRPLVGVDQSEVGDFAPGKFTVIVYERERRGCALGQCAVVVAPVADKVIDKGLCGPGLLAHVLVGKYGDHLPLHRQAGIVLRLRLGFAASWSMGNTVYSVRSVSTRADQAQFVGRLRWSGGYATEEDNYAGGRK